jgi:hypothetical protein
VAAGRDGAEGVDRSETLADCNGASSHGDLIRALVNGLVTRRESKGV